MQRSAFYWLLFLVAFLFMACSAPQNQAPVIHLLEASATEIYAGQTVRLQVDASDPDGDSFTVRWTTPHGSITSAHSLQTTWQSPAEAGLHFMRVEVTDSNGAMVVGTKNIFVRDHVTLPAGTSVLVRLLHPIETGSVRVGDRFPIQVVEPVRRDGFALIETGAHGIAQVVRVQPADDQKLGSVALAITKLQAADGQMLALDAVDATDSTGNAGNGIPRSINEVGPEAGITGLRSTSFWLMPGEAAVIPAGTVFAGATRNDAEVKVFADKVVRSEWAQPDPVSTYSCLGIEGVSYSEVMLTVYPDGVRVDGFTPGSSVEHSQIQIGDRITAVRVAGTEYKVVNMVDLTLAVRNASPGDKVTVLVRNVLRKVDATVEVDLCYAVP